MIIKKETELEVECYVTWKAGFKPEKALKHIASMLGYKPTMEKYKEVSRRVILTSLRTYNNKE